MHPIAKASITKYWELLKLFLLKTTCCSKGKQKQNENKPKRHLKIDAVPLSRGIKIQIWHLPIQKGLRIQCTHMKQKKTKTYNKGKKKQEKRINLKQTNKKKQTQKVCNCYGYNICICEWGYLYSVYIYSTYMYTHTHMSQLKPAHARLSLMGTASALEPPSPRLGAGAAPASGGTACVPGVGTEDGGDTGCKVQRSCWRTHGGSVWPLNTHPRALGTWRSFACHSAPGAPAGGDAQPRGAEGCSGSSCIPRGAAGLGSGLGWKRAHARRQRGTARVAGGVAEKLMFVLSLEN